MKVNVSRCKNFSSPLALALMKADFRVSKQTLSPLRRKESKRADHVFLARCIACYWVNRSLTSPPKVNYSKSIFRETAVSIHSDDNNLAQTISLASAFLHAREICITNLRLEI